LQICTLVQDTPQPEALPACAERTRWPAAGKIKVIETGGRERTYGNTAGRPRSRETLVSFLLMHVDRLDWVTGRHFRR